MNILLTKIINSSAINAVKCYAIELLNNYKEQHGTDLDLLKQDTKKVLLRGASDWKQYSYGGMSLISHYDITYRLFNGDLSKKIDCKSAMDMQVAYLEDAFYLIYRLL